MLVIFNHNSLNKDQLNALKLMNVDEVKYLPGDLSLKWASIDPGKDILDLTEFKEHIINNTAEGEEILVQGDFGATFQLVHYCIINNRIPLYATTSRSVEEIKIPDGSVEKKSIFKFVKFRKYSF